MIMMKNAQVMRNAATRVVDLFVFLRHPKVRSNGSFNMIKTAPLTLCYVHSLLDYVV